MAREIFQNALFPFFFLLISGISDGLDKWTRELWSKGIGGVIALGQEFLKRFVVVVVVVCFVFLVSLECKEYCDYIVKNHIFLWSQFYSQNLNQLVLNLALITRADWSQQGSSLWRSRGLSLVRPRLLITGGSPGHKGSSGHFPILCQ